MASCFDIERIIYRVDHLEQVKRLVRIARPIAVPAQKLQRFYVLQQHLHFCTIAPSRSQARGFPKNSR